MSTLAIFRFTMGLLVLTGICIGFYHENKIASAEKRLYRIIKCFIKACIITLEQKFSKKHSKENITDISEALSTVNRKEKFKRIA